MLQKGDDDEVIEMEDESLEEADEQSFRMDQF
jgi:hypothetical protein